MKAKATNEVEITNTIRRFGSKIVLDKLKELYVDDPKFNEFCEVFEKVFESEYPNINVKVVKIFDKWNEKKVLDRNAFIFLCIKHEFRYNLKQIGYERFMIFTANKSINGLSERIPVHRECIKKIQQFNEIWKTK